MEIIEITEKKEVRTIEVAEKEDIFLVGKSGGELDLNINLIKGGAIAHIYGILFGAGDAHYTINTLSHHIVPNTNSRVHLKGVFLDKSKLDYEGMIRIDKKAQLSDAYLKNDNLVIGNDAVVNSSPQLEIAADDVRASHGVTISTIDDLNLFYLQSRGIDLEHAHNLLIHGFINEILLLSGGRIGIESFALAEFPDFPAGSIDNAK